MLRIIILVCIGTHFTCFGDTIQNDDWKRKGFYRPRRNYHSQGQIQNFQSRSQSHQNASGSRENRFRQDPVVPNNSRHQRRSAFGSVNNLDPQSRNIVERSYNPYQHVATGSSPNSFGFNQNTQYSQNQGQDTLISQSHPFGTRQNSFGSSYHSSPQNQNLNKAFYQKPLSSNSFANNQNFQRQNSFGSNFGQNAILYQNFASNLEHANDQSFGTSNSQNSFRGYDYLPPRDKHKPPFVGPTYLPPRPDKPRTTTTELPFLTGTNNAAPAMAMLVPPDPEDNPATTTTTSKPFDREPFEIFPDVMTTKRVDVAPAMATPVPPEPEDDATPTTVMVTPSTTTTMKTPPPTTSPATTGPVPDRALIDETIPTTTTKRPTVQTTPNFEAPKYLPPTTSPEIPPKPAMAMPVPPECDPSDPSTYPQDIDLRNFGSDPCNPTPSTPEPNRNTQEEVTSTKTTTTKIVTTPSTTTTTKIVTTPTTPTTPYFKAPEYLPPTKEPDRHPPAPARAMPVVPECDPADPSTYPQAIDERFSTGDPCHPTPPTPEPNRNVQEEVTTLTTTTAAIVTTPSTTTTTKIVTTPTTPTTPYFKAPEYLPPTKEPDRHPPAPARAMPVVPECDPADPSTYPQAIDERFPTGDPCHPTPPSPEPNRNVQEEVTTLTTTTAAIVTTPSTTTTTKIVTTPTTPTTPYFKAPDYLPPTKEPDRHPPAPARTMPVVPECDPADPSTYPQAIDERFSTGDPCHPTPPSPEPNRNVQEEVTTLTTTTAAIVTTPSTTTTTKIVTTPTTPTTPYFKAPEYLPPTKEPDRPPPAPARAMPVVPECDPADPSTYPQAIDERFSTGDLCHPTPPSPEPNRNVQEEVTTLTTTTAAIVTTPSTTTTKIVTTPTTPTTPYFKAPEYLPPAKEPDRPPPAPARAMPVVPECDPADPSTYPQAIDERFSGGDPCHPIITITPEPNRSADEEITIATPTTIKIVTTSTPTTKFKAPVYLPPLNTTVGPAPARADPVPEPECDPADPSTFPLGSNPCIVPPTCTAPLPSAPKKRVARSVSTLRLEDLKGTPRPVWYVGIYDKTFTPRFRPICGGSVISEDVVISAAHCFWEDDTFARPAAHYAVGANKIHRPWGHEMDKRAQHSDVKEIIIPPRFRGEKTSYQDDIAILKLVTPFRYARGLRPLCVDFDDDFETEQLREGHSGTFAGWGDTDAVGTPTLRLLWLELPYVDIRTCLARYPETFLKYITSDKVCAGEYETGRALCKGDSGGGLVFWYGEPDTAVPYLRGIASTAPQVDNIQCNVQTVGAFTQVSTHRRFLQEHLPGVGGACRFRE